MAKEIKSLKHQHSSTKRNQIIDKAEVLFTKYSYTGVSMSNIARLAKITKAALYYHFASKEELYSEVLKKVFDELHDSLQITVDKEKSAEKRLQELIVVYVNFCLERKSLAMLMMQSLSMRDKRALAFLKKIRRRINQSIEPLVREVLRERKLPAKDVQLKIYFLVSILNAFAGGEMMGCKHNWKFEEMAKQIIDLIFPKKK
jgi:AcrR family transcriptional regulator